MPSRSVYRFTTCAFLFPLLLAPCQTPLVGGFGDPPFPSDHPPKSSYPGHHPTHHLHHSTPPLLCNGSRNHHVPPPHLYFKQTPALHRTPSRPPPWGEVRFPRQPQHGWPLAAPPPPPPPHFVDGNGYIVLWGAVDTNHCEVGGAR